MPDEEAREWCDLGNRRTRKGALALARKRNRKAAGRVIYEARPIEGDWRWALGAYLPPGEPEP